MPVLRMPRSLCLMSVLLIVCPVVTGCNQSSGFVMNESGKSMYARGEYTAARREFERALVDQPANPDYAFNVASAMRKQGDLIGAERMYRHALALDPRHQPSHHGIADMLVEQGRNAEADSHLREWADTQPYLAEAHVENAWFRSRQGDTAGAEQYLSRALQIDPKNPAAMAQLGDLYEVNGRPDEARAMYRRSLARNPFQSEVKARMAQSRRQPSMLQQAMMSAPQLAGYPPGSPMTSIPMQQASYQSGPYGPPTSMASGPQHFGPMPQPMAYQQPMTYQQPMPQQAMPQMQMPSQQVSHQQVAMQQFLANPPAMSPSQPMAMPQAMPMPSSMAMQAMPFQGFASTPGPQPALSFYGEQPGSSVGYPAMSGQAMQGVMPASYSTSTAPAYPASTFSPAAPISQAAGYGPAIPLNGMPAQTPMSLTAVPIVSPF